MKASPLSAIQNLRPIVDTIALIDGETWHRWAGDLVGRCVK